MNKKIKKYTVEVLAEGDPLFARVIIKAFHIPKGRKTIRINELEEMLKTLHLSINFVSEDNDIIKFDRVDISINKNDFLK
jgi:hypothetical protein